MNYTNKKTKILIAEDQPITRTLLEDILQDDYEVVKAIDGKDALERLEQDKDIDLVLLDVIMPELDGFEVCERLKENDATKDIPVIILTIMDQDRQEARGFELGVADYISKPVNRIRLLSRVKNQLVIKKQRDLLAEKNAELQVAIDHIKTLRHILPVCSFCRQVRNDDGYWQQVEDYMAGCRSSELSGSICPECQEKQGAANS